MMSVIRIAVLVLAGNVAVKAMRKPPTFVFDYAKPPESRWDGALELALVGKSWDETFGTIFAYHNASLFDKLTPDMYDRITTALRTNFPVQAQELQGIANQFAAVFPEQTVTYEYLAAWVYYHELGHADFGSDGAATTTTTTTSSHKTKRSNATGVDSSSVDATDESNRRSCTGLLAADTDGKVYHVANMDQSPPQVRDVTLQVKYIDSRLKSEHHNKNNITSRSSNDHDDDDDDEIVLFQGVDWYWFNTGTTRIVMKGKASFQENWRTDEHEGNIPISDMLDDIDSGTPSHVLFFRYAFERAVKDPTIGFDELVEVMSTVRLAAPEYIVMAGPGYMQGAVIARTRSGVASPGHKVLRLGDTDNNPTTVPDIIPWALVQTNYEHWQADATDDPRRRVAEEHLANFGQDFAASYLGLYAIASAYPVHATSTAYTAIMDVHTGSLQSVVRTMVCPVEDHDCFENANAHGLGFGVQTTSKNDEKVNMTNRSQSQNETSTPTATPTVTSPASVTPTAMPYLRTEREDNETSSSNSNNNSTTKKESSGGGGGTSFSIQDIIIAVLSGALLIALVFVVKFRLDLQRAQYNVIPDSDNDGTGASGKRWLLMFRML